MARNEEKAQAMLNRFLEAKREENAKPKEKRPFLASEVSDVPTAERWRNQILKEIGRKVSEIQNPALGEHRLRDLNDEINKLIREKGHWEARILELGGPDYAKTGPKITDSDGNEVDAATGKGVGYKYFGAAKTLPGVRELFDKPPEPKKRRSRYEMFKRIDADYYGYRDDEDGILVQLEAEAEKAAREAAIREWERVEAIKQEAKRSVKSGEVVTVQPVHASEEADKDLEELLREDGPGVSLEEPARREFVAHVPLPDEKEIERMVLERKKQELLSKYASEALIKEETEAKALLNIQR
ncbi:pre-mRNA-splicing factor ISY1 [Klebsormidium nitens]|uniref:Pre-mRNA-splicing factor ISY1 n=1 Tax=Klebsormidium nitens TaxID=105231 RepID=A0A0U9HIS0_KLENI|nr:pre-mRNA-splicing factor ISY1 [Klebsormidium nitens]|eukprot:GAQ80558.1 pre-mRNA-splicing factor ISY1 [Klebsormidium nitens]